VAQQVATFPTKEGELEHAATQRLCERSPDARRGDPSVARHVCETAGALERSPRPVISFGRVHTLGYVMPIAPPWGDTGMSPRPGARARSLSVAVSTCAGSAGLAHDLPVTVRRGLSDPPAP
jgi:hypothetical protein